jgi:hypothetical protein
MHIRRATPPVPDDENGGRCELVPTNRKSKSQSFEHANGNCRDDEQSNPEGSQAMPRLNLISISPQQRQPIPERGKMQNVRKSHSRFISSHEFSKSC